MERNFELDLAWKFVESTGTSLFLTGKAGTGKTTFLHKLQRESSKRMVVLAPTVTNKEIKLPTSLMPPSNSKSPTFLLSGLKLLTET